MFDAPCFVWEVPGTCNMQCEVDVFGHSPAVTIAGSGPFLWCAGWLQPWCGTLLTTCLIRGRMGFIFNLMLLLEVALCVVWCSACSVLKQPGTEASFYFHQSFNSANGCAEAHRKQLSKRPSKWYILNYIRILCMFKTDPEMAIHKFLLVSKAWLNHKPL